MAAWTHALPALLGKLSLAIALSFKVLLQGGVTPSGAGNIAGRAALTRVCSGSVNDTCRRLGHGLTLEGVGASSLSRLAVSEGSLCLVARALWMRNEKL
jgi:hypothetical protein